MQPTLPHFVTLFVFFVVVSVGCKAHEPPSVPGDPASRRVTLRLKSQPEAAVGDLTLRLVDLVHAAVREDAGIRYVSIATIVARADGRETRIQLDAEAVVAGYRLKLFMAGTLAARAGGPLEDTVVLDVTPSTDRSTP